MSEAELFNTVKASECWSGYFHPSPTQTSVLDHVRVFPTTPCESARHDPFYAPRTTLTSDRLYIDDNEPIRIRIDYIEWQPVRPTPNVPTTRRFDPSANANANGEEAEPVKSKEDEERERFDKVGYKIFANIGEAGLGVTSWWLDPGDEEEEGMEYEQ